jgi:hypothetical protein
VLKLSVKMLQKEGHERTCEHTSHFPETWFTDTCASLQIITVGSETPLSDTYLGLQIVGVDSETPLSLDPLHSGCRDDNAESGIT